MSERFEKALEFTLDFETGGDPEGGFVDDPADRGGATRWGISKRAHPEIDPASLSRDEAVAIYYADYWRPTAARLEAPEGAEALELALFDFAVHSGVRRAVPELQRLVGANPDGVIGPKTREAIARHAYNLLAAELCNRRRRMLEHLVLMDATQKRFERGWLRRVKALESAIEWGERP